MKNKNENINININFSELDYIAEYEKTPRTERYPIETTYDLISKISKDFPNSTALIQHVTAEIDEETVSLSFQALYKQVTQTANLLQPLLNNKDDVVSIMLPNLIENHLAIWGSQVVGIANPINSFLNVEHIVEIMKEVKTKVLFTLASSASPELWHKITQLVKHVPSLKTIIIVGPYDQTDPAYNPLKAEGINIIEFASERIKQVNDKYQGNIPLGTDTAMYFHTGGTTGRPKVARLYHSGIAYICQVHSDFNQHIGLTPSLSALPLFHVFAVVAAGLGVLTSGRTIVIMTGAGFRHPNVVKNWWYFVEKYHAITFPAVPTILAALINQPTEQYDLSHLKYISSGSAPLPVELKRAFEKKFQCEISNGYGMTETSGLVTRIINDFDCPENSVGNALVYSRLVAAEVDGDKLVKICRPNEAGVILVKGPHIFGGYLNEKDNINSIIDGQWFNTGDIGIVDERGRLTLTGRAKDLIIRGGHNIDPLLIENVLMQHQAIAQVTAIGQPDSYAGELPVAYVVLKPNQQVNEARLIAYCQEHISERAAIPKRIEILTELPVTVVGKIFKPALRNRATEYAVSALIEVEHLMLTAEFDGEIGQIINITGAKKQEESTIKEQLKGLSITVRFHQKVVT